MRLDPDALAPRLVGLRCRDGDPEPIRHAAAPMVHRDERQPRSASLPQSSSCCSRAPRRRFAPTHVALREQPVCRSRLSGTRIQTCEATIQAPDRHLPLPAVRTQGLLPLELPHSRGKRLDRHRSRKPSCQASAGVPAVSPPAVRWSGTTSNVGSRSRRVRRSPRSGIGRCRWCICRNPDSSEGQARAADQARFHRGRAKTHALAR